MKRTLVIGDIHGGFKALQQVLIKAKFDAEKDQLICLGDYVDGWSESAEVVDFLLGIQNKAKFCNNGNDPIFIRGNHDEWCNEWLQTGVAKRIWLTQGGAATFESYQRTNLHLEDSHKKFFKNLHNYYIDNQNRGFVHAGYQSYDGLGNDTAANYMWDREIAYMLPMRSSDPIPRVLRPHEELYIGHTTTLQWKTTDPINLHGKYWNLDTGGGWSGKLTIMDIDTKEYWQSDFVKDLYPEEKGR